MSKSIQLVGNDVIVKEGNKITAVAANENNKSYQQIKKETNNFTENMFQKTELEILRETIDQLILDSLGGI